MSAPTPSIAGPGSRRGAWREPSPSWFSAFCSASTSRTSAATTSRWERSEESWCCCSGSGSWRWCSWARLKWIGRSRPAARTAGPQPDDRPDRVPRL